MKGGVGPRAWVVGSVVVGCVVAYVSTCPVLADAHPVDAFLAAHPAVAKAIIWEFPPDAAKYREDNPNAPSIWTRFTLVPYPSTYPSLTLRVYSSELTGGASGVPLDLDQLNFDLDPGQIISTQPVNGLGAIVRAPLTLKPGTLDQVPSGDQSSDMGAAIRDWTAWSDAARQQLRDRFDAYSAWAKTACPLYAQYAASNFAEKPAGFDEAFSTVVDPDPSPILDPPVNLQPDDVNIPGVPWTVLAANDAFALYVRLVAANLALELNHCVPWSLTEYNGAELALLLDGRSRFRWAPVGPSKWGDITVAGHVAASPVIPAPPLITLGFLAQNGLIGQDRLETVVRLFEWERQNLDHVASGTTDPPLPNGVEYFGYNGRTPLSRMINGTEMMLPVLTGGGGSLYDPLLRHWVGGCGGAASFNAEVLRLVNLPVESTTYGHNQNRFTIGPDQRVAVAHTDDPYGMRHAPEVPTAEVLIDDATFDAWFVNADQSEWTANVSRRAADLYFQYLPADLLEYDCLDASLNRDHQNSLAYGRAFKGVYTVAEMEAKGLWDLMKAKIENAGGCSAFGYPGVVLP